MIENFVNKIHVGHVIDVLKQIPGNSIDVCVTSPPYWGLRDYGKSTSVIWDGDVNCKHEWGDKIIKHSYGNVGNNPSIGNQKIDAMRGTENKGNFCIKCGAWNGQLGLEPHPQMYINHIVEIFREVGRVLKDSGTLWLNIGDTYCGGGTHHGKWKESGKHRLSKGNDYMSGLEPQAATNLDMDDKWLQPKQQLMIPERVAIAMQEDGWIKRNTVIWYKPNAMPSSVKDRMNTTYEMIFFFSKARRYYFDLDSIRAPHKYPKDVIRRILQDKKDNINPFAKGSEDKQWRRDIKVKEYKSKYKKNHGQTLQGLIRNQSIAKDRAISRKEAEKLFPNNESLQKEYIKYVHNHSGHFKGKNPGDTWIINTKPFKGAHFAVYPTTLIERILKCAAPREVCSKCGKNRKRIIELGKIIFKGGSNKGKLSNNLESIKLSKIKCKAVETREHITVGWSKCNCNKEFKPGIVLDTFMGSGTTGLVAKQMGLNWIGIELNEQYAREIAIPRIGSGTVEMYDVDRVKIVKVLEERKIEKLSDNIPTGKNPKCPFTVECTFRINNLCYMNPNKRVKYCPEVDK